MPQETFDLYCHVNFVTAKAIRVNLGTSVDWLPKSQIECYEHDVEEIEVGDTVTLALPEWLAKEKGII